jgi:hypothetical protein
MSASIRLVAAAKLGALFLAPFAVAIATYQLALLFPGQIKVEHWRALASLSFVVFGGVAVSLVWRSHNSLMGKFVLIFVVLLAFLFFALAFSARSNCGGESELIGTPTQAVEVASCKQ